MVDDLASTVVNSLIASRPAVGGRVGLAAFAKSPSKAKGGKSFVDGSGLRSPALCAGLPSVHTHAVTSVIIGCVDGQPADV